MGMKGTVKDHQTELRFGGGGTCGVGDMCKHTGSKGLGFQGEIALCKRILSAIIVICQTVKRGNRKPGPLYPAGFESG